MSNDKKNKNKIGFSIFLTSVLTFFLLGIYSADHISNLYVKNIKKSDINVIYTSNEKDLDLTKFWETYSLLKKRYYSLDGIQKSDLVDGAISGMVNSLGDKHSEFMTNKEAKSFNDVLNGDFEGIGAIVDKIPIGVRIDRILKGSPAKKYGLQKGDVIIQANSFNLENLNLIESVDKIKGPAGTEVTLKIIRPGEEDIIERNVVRAKIKIPTVETETFDDNENIGYISLNIYGENSSLEFRNALNLFRDKDGIIIDLRDNGGGFLQSAVQILSNFIKSGENLVQVKGRQILNNVSYPSFNTGGIYDGKIVVIINGNSASASEITAGALRDYNKAILVGTKTYGKGSVQEPFSFSDGSQIKFTTAKWFTPNGTNIDENGINPDIFIEFKKQDYDLEECKLVGICDKNLNQEEFDLYDRQLEESKNILKYFVDFDSPNIAISKFLEKNPDYKKDLNESN